jgi:hypothetical protein
MASPGSGQPPDDLLSGFEHNGRRGELRAYLTTTLIASAYIFDTAFRLGAYHAIYYSQLQHVAVFSLVILIAVAFIRRQARVHYSVMALFAVPVAVFFFRLATPTKHSAGAGHVIDNVLVILNAIVTPIILWVIARLLAPDYFGLHSRRLKITVAATLTIVAAIGYTSGRFNYRTLTCQDFITAGDKPPANCARHGNRHPGPMAPRSLVGNLLLGRQEAGRQLASDLLPPSDRPSRTG